MVCDPKSYASEPESAHARTHTYTFTQVLFLHNTSIVYLGPQTVDLGPRTSDLGPRSSDHSLSHSVSGCQSHSLSLSLSIFQSQSFLVSPASFPSWTPNSCPPWLPHVIPQMIPMCAMAFPNDSVSKPFPFRSQKIRAHGKTPQAHPLKTAPGRPEPRTLLFI